MKIISGADGCRGGWVVVSKDLESGNISWRLCRTFEDILKGTDFPEVLAIDIPIGLKEKGGRLCDQSARKVLGPVRSSSVFSAPLQQVLKSTSYLEACSIREGIEGKRMSRQAYAILPKIREVDAVMSSAPNLQSQVREVHPEVSFHFMNEARTPLQSKKTASGRQERLALLTPIFGDGVFQALEARRELSSQPDDVLDAFAALWTAERIYQGVARPLPEFPEVDSKGLRMEIVY
ncbi:MAG: DUF429 domain-containing protein [Anaerolineales bacterium]|uniref:DUF429 domain-containing protein n=1 Tax=Candidatus Villigracilis vicinus TaxID=3140679 RepID=UPI003136B73A|nr:DUF429 domain-containing protein [Anaerolineales bacterium]